MAIISLDYLRYISAGVAEVPTQHAIDHIEKEEDRQLETELANSVINNLECRLMDAANSKQRHLVVMGLDQSNRRFYGGKVTGTAGWPVAGALKVWEYLMVRGMQPTVEAGWAHGEASGGEYKIVVRW